MPKQSEPFKIGDEFTAKFDFSKNPPEMEILSVSYKSNTNETKTKETK